MEGHCYGENSLDLRFDLTENGRPMGIPDLNSSLLLFPLAFRASTKLDFSLVVLVFV